MYNKKHLFLLVAFFLILIWSAMSPHDYFTWFLEVLPALIGLAILTFTYKKFPLTNFLYVLIFIHAVILMVGGHYTYAEVPLGYWVKEIFDFSRNHYDRLGHLAQGFIPALIAREIIIRKNVVNGRKWQFVFIVSLCLAISAIYEFIEWWVAIGTGTAADSFLGTQGDIWDTQWDMFLAFVGSIIALLTLSRIHDKFLKQIDLKK
jgi:putative membrane protein